MFRRNRVVAVRGYELGATGSVRGRGVELLSVAAALAAAVNEDEDHGADKEETAASGDTNNGTSCHGVRPGALWTVADVLCGLGNVDGVAREDATADADKITVLGSLFAPGSQSYEDWGEEVSGMPKPIKDRGLQFARYRWFGVDRKQLTQP